MKTRIPRILVVEDNKTDLLLFEQALAANEWRVKLSIARDGEEAMDRLVLDGNHAEAPDVILLDINLPKRNGIEVLAEIKSDSRLRRIPVIVMTTSAGPREISRVYDLHANLCMTKPLEFEHFCRAIRFVEQWLELAELAEE